MILILLLLFSPVHALWEFGNHKFNIVNVTSELTVIVIDNFFRHIDRIEQVQTKRAQDRDYYPGTRWKLLKPIDHWYFEGRQCGFSEINSPPQALMPGQKIPHVDGDAEALIVYLNDIAGTSFYRHRGTGYTRLNFTMEELKIFNEVEHAKHLEGYMSGSNDRWEMIYHVEPKRNRAVVYNGSFFHTTHTKAPYRRTFGCFTTREPLPYTYP